MKVNGRGSAASSSSSDYARAKNLSSSICEFPKRPGFKTHQCDSYRTGLVKVCHWPILCKSSIRGLGDGVHTHDNYNQHYFVLLFCGESALWWTPGGPKLMPCLFGPLINPWGDSICEIHKGTTSIFQGILYNLLYNVEIVDYEKKCLLTMILGAGGWEDY